jgi:hypothetical protein
LLLAPAWELTRRQLDRHLCRLAAILQRQHLCADALRAAKVAERITRRKAGDRTLPGTRPEEKAVEGLCAAPTCSICSRPLAPYTKWMRLRVVASMKGYTSFQSLAGPGRSGRQCAVLDTRQCHDCKESSSRQR